MLYPFPQSELLMAFPVSAITSLSIHLRRCFLSFTAHIGQ